MISDKTLKAIEYDKIMLAVSKYAVLGETKNNINSFTPVTDCKEAEILLKKTEEAYKYLYTYYASAYLAKHFSIIKSLCLIPHTDNNALPSTETPSNHKSSYSHQTLQW